MEAKFPSGTVSLINDLVEKAVSLNASDVHIEPGSMNLRVRYRVDGILQNGILVSRSMHQQIISRIKIMADLDISEQRVPQDGRAFIKVSGKEFDLRISVIPTIFGEKAVLRLLERNRPSLPLESLGFQPEDLDHFKKSITRPQGMIVVCGPTGCGKTTTLYSSLEKINRDDINIMTIEDPVEYQLGGINQMQVNNKTGLTFAKGLRGMLRQDPDVIMVGEIRDTETAGVALQAAMTGHLVLSTLHTNDAASAVTRLIDMGIEPYLISDTLICVISQRLLRKICTVCGAKGCRSCGGTGYKGRIGVFEMMRASPQVRDCIAKRPDIKAITKASGHRSMMDGAKVLLDQGMTTPEEINRTVNIET